METFAVFPGWSIPFIQGQSLKTLQQVNGRPVVIVYVVPKIAVTVLTARAASASTDMGPGPVQRCHDGGFVGFVFRLAGAGAAEDHGEGG